MLSIENPPPDPSYQPLSINNDERPTQNAAILDHSTFPNFSLRDYVFGCRSKDIENNWPFSLKNLQLCLKHGVKDLLPPFQSPNRVRNQRGESSTSSVLHGEFSEPKEPVELEQSDAKFDEKLVRTCTESSSCRCEGENGFSSTMTSISQPQKELVSTSGPSSSSLKTDTLSETPAEVERTCFPASEKNESKIKTSSKRCKIIRKSTNHVDQTSTVDIAASLSTVSESMASKICPVCKTFSSSSNTTLNAHIDQCLSIASTPKCTSDSKLTRFRIKPRKTKLMVDIYATARSCTLEELDRRNGTAWATSSGFPAENIENCQINEGKKQKVMPVHPEDIDDHSAGAVYIDANGTKLRILSKFSSSSSLSISQNELGSKKLNGVTVRKFHSAKKKKGHSTKHHKYLKVAAEGRKVPSQRCISQVQGHTERNGCSRLEVHKITKQAKPHDSGTLRQWACSKRTRASVSTRKEGYQPSTFKWHVDTDPSVLADSLFDRSQVEHCVSSPESSERTDNMEYEAYISDKKGRSPVRRSLRSSFSGEMVDIGSPTQMKYQTPPGFNKKLSSNYHENAVKVRNLNSSRRDEFHVSSRSSTGSKPSPRFNRFSTFDHSRSSSDGSIESDQSAKEEVTKVSELENRSNREAMSKAIALSSSDSEPEYGGCHELKNMDSHIRIDVEFQENIKGLELGSRQNSFHEDVSVDSSSKLVPNESFTCFCKTNNNVKTRCGTLQSTQNCSCTFYGSSDGAKGGFGIGQDMFFTDEDCSAMIGHDVQGELDSEAKRGMSSFEVDPISIPGPPGSFLPSPPRDMRSSEYRGTSSLSYSWVHSCLDQHELIDGDSSGSPISATSTISNTTASRSCFKHNNPSRVSSDVFHDKFGSVSPKARALPHVNGDMFKVNKLPVETGALGVVNNGQPCCCQRVGINVTYPEPQLTRHHAMTSETMPAMDRRPNSFDIMAEGPGQTTPESMGFPVNKSPFKSYPGPKFSSPREPASPVTSNSVLRLMGKNLMVVNKDEEDVAMSLKQPQLSQVPSFSGGSSQHVRNQASSGSYPHWPHQNAGNLLGQSLDVTSSRGFGSPVNLNMSLPHGQAPTTLFLKQHTASQARFIANDPKHLVSPFCYQPKDASNLNKPATIHSSSFQSTPSRKDHASPVKWDCNSEPPYVCRRGVF
ncbi:uncharacterized protein LOC111500225 [Cucurbita maxima]|uniref:Uncharacterized protein LOC111500225 n=1 Tax=Cucurbita maxima TaxID=3661 RepID=A0A6J1KZC6_CUCMA|nr:uncharacterized protein LOC111500225 [Cucurbita maxima]XP_023007673.1 uncharacterized protein LOC111500225 [Cucurbita maxima]